MINSYRHKLDALHDWAEAARDVGWLTREDIQPLSQQDDSQLVSLFKEQGEKPLIVAFFGGTGVGKSSLLNRLAGEEIARTGIQRPTSMEVTLYLHRDFEGDLLPENLPTEQTRIAWHNQDNRRFVAWLDLPDMDSTARENAALVEAWLPFVDWVIYVVSPERYHDDMGWRFLQQRGNQHAWLFVMNHWDEGTEEQLEDFRNKLVSTGFHHPTILRTICADGRADDDFPQLEAIINDAIARHGLALLKSLGVQARIETADAQLGKWLQTLNGKQRWDEAASTWQSTCERYLDKLENQLATRADALEQSLRASKRNETAETLSPESIAGSLWSGRSEMIVEDLVIELANALQNLGLPFRPFENRLKALQTEAPKTIQAPLTEALELAMAKPGTAWQRALYKTMDWLSFLLPLAAAGWAVFHLANTFRYATLGERPFLGVNFAVHSALMIALAWLIPWLIKRRIKPSIVSSIRQGLSRGIRSARTALNARLDSVWQSVNRDKAEIVEQIESFQQELAKLKSNAHQQVGDFVADEPGHTARLQTPAVTPP